MLTSSDSLIIKDHECSCRALHATEAHHRNFPELRAEGPSAREAAGRLRHQLDRALDAAPSQWRREAITQAIADVQAYLDQHA